MPQAPSGIPSTLPQYHERLYFLRRTAGHRPAAGWLSDHLARQGRAGPRRRPHRGPQGHSPQREGRRRLGHRHPDLLLAAGPARHPRQPVRHRRRHRAGIGLPGQSRGGGPARHRLEGHRRTRRPLSRPRLHGPHRPGPAQRQRPELRPAHRQRPHRRRPQPHLRGSHRHRPPREAPVRPVQPRAHRRRHAGLHQLRRRPRQAQVLPLRRRPQHPAGNLHPSRRPVLRHRPPAGLPRRLPRDEIPLRGLQRRPLCQPQRCLPARPGRGHRPEAHPRRRPAGPRQPLHGHPGPDRARRPHLRQADRPERRQHPRHAAEG